MWKGTNQLWDVNPCHSAVLHSTSNLRQSVHSGLSEALHDEAEAPVGSKLGVACDQEVKVETQDATLQSNLNLISWHVQPTHYLSQSWLAGRFLTFSLAKPTRLVI